MAKKRVRVDLSERGASRRSSKIENEKSGDNRIIQNKIRYLK